MTDHAVTSELVVRPLEDGNFQYVSNQVTGWDEDLEIPWYTPRLTDEEWQYYYENENGQNEYSITDRNSEIDHEQPEGNDLSDKERWEKGYDLPIEEEKREEAETDCLMVMDKISDIYLHADKGNASNVVLSSETLEQMQKVVGESGYPVITSVEYCTMSNYDKMDRFLQACLEGEDTSVILYSLSNSGGASRKEYIFDGSEMYLLTAGADWNDSCDPVVSYISYTRIDEWKYTEKGDSVINCACRSHRKLQRLLMGASSSE